MPRQRLQQVLASSFEPKSVVLSFARVSYGEGRPGFPDSGWKYRRQDAVVQKRLQELQKKIDAEQNRNEFLRQQIEQAQAPKSEEELATDSPLPPAPAEFSPQSNSTATASITSSNGPSFDAVATRPEDEAKVFDPAVSQHDGIVLGISIGSTRYRDAAAKLPTTTTCAPVTTSK